MSTIVEQIDRCLNAEVPANIYVRFLESESLCFDDSYVEPGMCAQVLRSQLIYNKSKDEVEMFKFTLSFIPFENINKTKEKANYYDEDGNATLTAREAGWYHAVDTLFVMADDDSSMEFLSYEELDASLTHLSTEELISVLNSCGFNFIAGELDIYRLISDYFVNGQIYTKIGAYLRYWLYCQEKIKSEEIQNSSLIKEDEHIELNKIFSF